MSTTQEHWMFSICLPDINWGIKNSKSCMQSWLLAQIFANLEQINDFKAIN